MASFTDWLAEGIGRAVQDIRQRVVERGWFGEAITPRSQTITLGAPGEQSPGERLGWWRRDDAAQPSHPGERDRTDTMREPKAPDRGIDL